MATLNDITSSNWQLGLKQSSIVQGNEDIHQCINIICTTVRGTDPFRPDFGCGIYDYIDKPVNIAIPKMKNEIAVAVLKYETRVKIIRILHSINESNISFNIEWKMNDLTEATTLNYGTSS